jgi:hypothetical protein
MIGVLIGLIFACGRLEERIQSLERKIDSQALCSVYFALELYRHPGYRLLARAHKNQVSR